MKLSEFINSPLSWIVVVVLLAVFVFVDVVREWRRDKRHLK